MSQLRVILSGGGTGGHIFPAIAIANEVRKMVPHAEILFVGALGRMEMEKVPAAGYRIIGIPIAGLQRRLTLSNLKLPFLLVQSMIKTRKILRDFQPHVVVGTGGYASGPLIRNATAMKIPALIQEQNSYAGITNKLLGKSVSKICVAYDGMEKFFPREKLVLTGNPVRQDLRFVGGLKEEARNYFDLDPGKRTLLVIGGSQGARTINEAVAAGLKTLAQHNIQLLWQTGQSYYSNAVREARDFHARHLYAHAFITRMDLAYAAADLVVSRAGASSVSELCNLGMPAILVPSPNVAEDHQTKNAMALVNRNAALLVKDSEARATLIDTAIGLIDNEEKLRGLSSRISTLAHPDAATLIAKEVLMLAGHRVG